MTDREKRKAQRQAKREERRKNRKPFNETGVGKFLEQAGSTILESLGEIIPDKGVFAVVKDLIIKDEALSEKDREIALFLLEMDSKEMEEITKRLQSDNEHTITRLVRPVSYSLFLILFFVLVFFDGNVGGFEVNPDYISVIQTLFSTMTMFYFGSRGAEKITKYLNEK